MECTYLAAEVKRRYCCNLGIAPADLTQVGGRSGRSRATWERTIALLRAPQQKTQEAIVRIGWGLRGSRTDAYLADAVARWLLARCRSEASRDAYLATICRWLCWAPHGHRRLTLVEQCRAQATEVTEWLSHMEDQEALAIRTIVRHREALRSWYGWLCDLKLLSGGIPFDRATTRLWRVQHNSIRRGDGTRQALTQDQAQRLARWCLTVAPPATGFGILLQTVSGLRSWEVANAERARLVETPNVSIIPTDMKGSDTFECREASPIVTLRVHGKGDRFRTVVLEDVVVQAWQRYQASHRLQGSRGALIAAGRGGGHVTAQTVQRWAKQGLAAAGRPDLSSHDLRRTAVTLLVERGATLLQAQQLLGHSSIELTSRCYVVRPRPLTVTTGITGTSP